MPLEPGQPFTTLPLSQFPLPEFQDYSPFGQVVRLGGMESLLPWLASMLLGNQLFRSQGFAALGGGSGNIYRSMQEMQLTLSRESLLKNLGVEQRQDYQRFLTGLAHLTGMDTSDTETRQSIRRVSELLDRLTPILVRSLPDLVDTLSGLRGSAAVMSDRMYSASRFRLDPLTGQVGMRPQEIEMLSRRTYEELFAGRRYRERLMTAGEAGSLFDQLQRQAMLPTVTLQDLSPDQLRQAALPLLLDEQQRQRLIAAQTSREVLEILRSTVPGGEAQLRTALGQTLRDLNVQQVVNSLRSYEKALTAIREIFGDAGHPNAPVPQLLQALQSLTADQLLQTDPDRLAQILRTTAALGRAAGISMQGVMLQQNAAAMMATQLGLPGQAGLQLAEGSLAWRAALVQSGILGHRVWGLSSLDQQTDLDLKLRLGAENSVLANRLGALLRLFEMRPEALRPGSRAQELVEDLRQGRGIGYISAEEFQRLLSEGTTLSQREITEMLAQRELNREVATRYRVGDLIRRRAQGEEWQRQLERQLQIPVRVALTETFQDLPTEAARQTALAGATAVARAIRNLTPQQMSDARARNRAIGQALLEALREDQATRDRLQNLGNEDRQREWAEFQAEVLYGRAAEDTRRTFGVTLQDMQLQHNQDLLRQTERLREEMSLNAQLESAFVGLGRGSFWQRAVEAVLNYREVDQGGLAKVFMQALGGVSRSELTEELNRQLERLRQTYQETRQIQQELLNAPPGENRDQLQQQYADKVEALRQTTRALVGFAERSQLLLDVPLTERQVDDVLLQQQSLAREAMRRESTSRSLRELYRMERTASRALERRFLEYPQAHVFYGGQVIQSVRQIRDARQELEGLADRYAGGDIGRLLKGETIPELSAEEHQRTMERVWELWRSIQDNTLNLKTHVSSGASYRWLGSTEFETLTDLSERIRQTLGEESPGGLLSELLTMPQADLDRLRTEMERQQQPIAEDVWQTLQKARQSVESSKAVLEQTRSETQAVPLEPLIEQLLGVKIPVSKLSESSAWKALETLARTDEGTLGNLALLAQDVARVHTAMRQKESGPITLEQFLEKEPRTSEVWRAASRLHALGGRELLTLRESVLAETLAPEEALPELNRILATSVPGDFHKLLSKEEQEESKTFQIGQLLVRPDGGGTLHLGPADGAPGSAR